MTHDFVNDANHIGLITTTDSSFHTIVDYDLAIYPPSVATFVARAMCMNSTTGDCAAFEQPFAAKCDGTTSSMLGTTLPNLSIIQKDFALILTNIEIAFNGTKVELHVKGKASTTLDWMGILEATMFYQP